MSFDEHGIPRWTKKFVIPKGYLTTRNKFMRCEKLYLGYEVNLRRFATIKATPGNVELRDVASLLTRRVLRNGQPASLQALFDAGAGKSDADVRALMASGRGHGKPGGHLAGLPLSEPRRTLEEPAGRRVYEQ